MDFTPVWISLKTTLTATAITFVAGVLTARWRYSYSGKLANIIDILFVLPLALPPTVIGLLLLLLLGKGSPVGNIVQIVFTWSGVVIACIVVSFPLMYQSAKASFQQIDNTLIDLARIDGFSEWRILWRVMVPLAMPGLAAGIVLSFVRSLGEFGATLMIAGNIPGITQTMPVAIFFAVEGGNNQYALALSVINIIISLSAIAIINYLEKRQ